MPVTGLPIAVEGALNNLLTASHVSSWKLQGNGKSTTLILKFIDNEQGAMADQHSSIISYKKKSSGQIRREKQRAEEYFKEKQQKENIVTAKEQEPKNENDIGKERKNKFEESRIRPTKEQKEEASFGNTFTEEKGTSVLTTESTTQLSRTKEDAHTFAQERTTRPTIVTMTEKLGQRTKIFNRCKHSKV